MHVAQGGLMNLNWFFILYNSVSNAHKSVFGLFKKQLTHWPKQENTEQGRKQGRQWGR